MGLERWMSATEALLAAAWMGTHAWRGWAICRVPVYVPEMVGPNSASCEPYATLLFCKRVNCVTQQRCRTGALPRPK